MYKLSCFAVFIFLFFRSSGQVSFSFQPPLSGIVQKNQLWNITLGSSSNSPINVTIGLAMFDMKDNQPVMTAYARPILLIKGLHQLKASDVLPIDYNYLSAAFNINSLQNAFLPVGDYRVCYTVYLDNRNSESILSEDCTNIEVDPLSPPQLNSPADSEIVETNYPHFSWLPPTPVILFGDLNYDFLITEVQPGQSTTAAIQENLPVYFAHHLFSNSFNYPASYKSLDTSKVYAWRIVAKNGETYSAQSEVWTFSIGTKKAEQLMPANGIYFELKNENDLPSTGIIPNNILGIKYYSYDRTHDAVIKFSDENGRLVKEFVKTIQYGNNFFVFQLDHHFSDGKNYSIQISDLQSSNFKTSFRIQSNKTKN